MKFVGALFTLKSQQNRLLKKKWKRKTQRRKHGSKLHLSIRADPCLRFFPFFFFFPSNMFWLFSSELCTHCSRVPPLFSNFFIKNWFHGTIHIFKNYFVTMFSVFSFSKISSIQTDHKPNEHEIISLITILHWFQ